MTEPRPVPEDDPVARLQRQAERLADVSDLAELWERVKPIAGGGLLMRACIDAAHDGDEELIASLMSRLEPGNPLGDALREVGREALLQRARAVLACGLAARACIQDRSDDLSARLADALNALLAERGGARRVAPQPPTSTSAADADGRAQTVDRLCLAYHATLGADGDLAMAVLDLTRDFMGLPRPCPQG